ncbi:hypothetical protein [Nocardioides albus]|uniref:Putative lipid-binding transport protein (Tim44 family) n=1 Tax=Nocardioides albus TaxID=1841 RepID=A0A7W5F9L2_9ACTN|nr:hypothetical protein [Nocardioides albus]MBB3090429.1 putative lipid-binding transport protein (Tim44 family) [Nocardioides albus]GGU23842.1 hypothetical protein GCM10007979_23120 [Nocardioides albus]
MAQVGTTSETESSDGVWGTLGWSYPGLGLGALIGAAFAGPSAIGVWAPWEQLGRMTFGFSAALAIGGGALALCIGWVVESRKRPAQSPEASDTTASAGDGVGERTPAADQAAEAVDPTAALLGRLSSTRIVLWVISGGLCVAMGMLGEVSRSRTNRLPVGTKTGDAVSAEIWTAAMIAVALAVAGLVILCLVEDRVRGSQRDWLRAQLREPMPPAKRARQFYRSRSTPHASRACALLAAPLIAAGLAVLVVGSVDLGGAFAGSTATYAGLRMWGIVAVLMGLLLVALGVRRATRWHRENSELRAELVERWPLKPASRPAEAAG